jgi:hypothetical protein
LLARAGSSWSPEVAAVANGLESGSVFGPGRVVKVAVSQPYRTR